jgi:O-antigen/teichoic acid export membrane protein
VADRQAPARGFAWAGAVNLIGGVIGSGVTLVLAAVVGQHLGTRGAGTYFLVVAVFMIVSNVAELGADTGLVRFVSSARATGRDGEIRWLIRTAVAPVLLIGLGVVAAAGVVVRARPELFPELSPAFIVVAAIVAVLSSLMAVVLAVIRGLGDVVAYPLLQNGVVPLLRLGGIAAVLVAGHGVTGVLAAWLAPVTIGLLAATVVAVRLLDRARTGRVPLSPAQRSVVSREFWTFSAARGVSAGVEILLEWADVLIVGALTSTTEAGIYAVATRCARGGDVVQQAARIAIGPVISAALARGERDTVRDLYGLVTAAMIWVAWPFYLVLAIFGSSFLAIFGPGFADGAVALAILAIAMAVATAAGAVQTILLMGGRGTWQLADK